MIASVAEFPERIYNMFDTKAYNTKGTYSIKMYEMGVPISVVIDDFLPINTAWGDNQFTWINTQKELWPILLEKAFSKLMGNYMTIEGGWPIDAGTALMGTWGESFNSSNYATNPTGFHDLIKSWDSQNAVMWAATSASLNGIIGGHAYSLINALTLSNG
jgi:hypothetical protein